MAVSAVACTLVDHRIGLFGQLVVVEIEDERFLDLNGILQTGLDEVQGTIPNADSVTR